MIWLNLQVTELAAGYAALHDFLARMRQEWLPGFERSYQRRSAEYRKALAKYEQRGLFLRTLLRKPKQPGRMPDLYPAQVESRLWQGWFEAISVAEQDPDVFSLPAGESGRRDDYLALHGLRLAKAGPELALLIGQRAIFLAGAAGQGPAQVAALLANSPHALPICAADGESWPPAEGEQLIDGRALYALADHLLARHQTLAGGPAFSALQAAEKLTAREKDGLLRMAATL